MPGVRSIGKQRAGDDGAHHYVIGEPERSEKPIRCSMEIVFIQRRLFAPLLVSMPPRHDRVGNRSGSNGIPRHVGGALWINAVAYGQEIETVVDTVRVARGVALLKIPESNSVNYRHTSCREGENAARGDVSSASPISRKDQ